MMAIGFAFGIMQFNPGEPTPGGSESAAGLGGCVLSNTAFEDPGTFHTEEDIFSKLPADKVALLNSSVQKDRVKMIIAQFDDPRVKKYDDTVKVNPALLMAIWYGEQKWDEDNPQKAFGYGYMDGRTLDEYKSFEAQVAGAVKVINDAMKNRGNYTLPAGESIFTRLFFNYTTAMKNTYKSNGYVADKSNPRIQILNYLVPESVTCTTSTDGLKVPYLEQCGAPWGTQNPKGTSGSQLGHVCTKKSGGQFGPNICCSGCNLTAMSMVAKYFGVNKNPFELGKAIPNPKEFSADTWASAIGLKYIPFSFPNYNTFPIEEIKTQLGKNQPVIWHMTSYNTGTSTIHKNGHYNVIIGVTSQGDLVVNDPANLAGKGFVYKNDMAKYGSFSGGYKFEFFAFSK